MEKITVGLDRLEIHELDVDPMPDVDAIEFDVRATVRELDAETIAAISEKRLEPLELVCAVYEDE